MSTKVAIILVIILVVLYFIAVGGAVVRSGEGGKSNPEATQGSFSAVLGKMTGFLAPKARISGKCDNKNVRFDFVLPAPSYECSYSITPKDGKDYGKSELVVTAPDGLNVFVLASFPADKFKKHKRNKERCFLPNDNGEYKVGAYYLKIETDADAPENPWDCLYKQKNLDDPVSLTATDGTLNITVTCVGCGKNGRKSPTLKAQ